MFTPYRQLLKIPGAFRFSIAGFVARMPISMDSLALIFIVYHASHSYALAGTLAAVGEIVVTGAVPFWARIADRFGQSRTLYIVIPSRAIFLTLFILLVTHHAPVWTWFVTIIGVELSVINAGGLVRRRWSWILGDDRHLINTAYSYEGLMDEFIFILGPVIATFCATTIAPAAALIVGLVLMVSGSTVFALQKSSEPPPHPRDLAAPHPAVMRNPTMQAIFFSTIFLGAFFSAVGLVVVAFAQERHATSQTGLVLAAWAAGSGVAAFINGSIKWKINHARRFTIFLSALTLLSVPLIFVHNLPFLVLALFCNGLAIAPLMVAAYGVAENAVPSEQITETLAWVFAGLPVGGALSSAFSGWMIDNYGAQRAFLVPVGALCFAMAMSLPYFRTWNRLRSAS
ncbi:MAG TPA: MFS transporter [Candidatus Nanopelagicaceae bacterium]